MRWYPEGMSEERENSQNSLPPAAPIPAEPAVPMLPPSPRSGTSLPASVLWPKGFCPNPGGQPKGKRVSTRIMEMMGMPISELDKVLADKTRDARDHLAARAIKRALRDEDGHSDLREVLDRTEGPVDRNINVRAMQAPDVPLEDAIRMAKRIEREQDGSF